jgi:hypothetical protein
MRAVLSETTGSDRRSAAPPLPPLRLAARVRLALEVLLVYGRALRWLRRMTLTEMAAQARAGHPAGSGVHPAQEHQLALRVGAAVMATLRPLPTDKRCLVRSLVTLRMLARRSIPAILVIGVQPGSEFAAHAWVEHDGEPILPRGTFARLTEL